MRKLCAFGESTGEKDERGYPVRRDWAADYRGEWIASSAPVEIQRLSRVDGREETIDTGLLMIVQARADRAAAPVKRLARRLLNDGLAALLAIVAVTIALWVYRDGPQSPSAGLLSARATNTVSVFGFVSDGPPLPRDGGAMSDQVRVRDDARRGACQGIFALDTDWLLCGGQRQCRHRRFARVP